MNVGGSDYPRRQLERRTGNLAQLGGTRHCELTEGAAKGTRAVDVDTGAGLTFTVLPDRGMDVSRCSFKGTNIVHLTANGEVAPAFYNAVGTEWLRSFFGGLLTTCGLTNFGAPCEDGDESLGMHGRISNTPARRFRDASDWEGDEYVIRLQGVMDECAVFGDKLRMTRTIETRLGAKSLIITDEVENFGFKTSPFTILYHINIGFPLLDEGAELVVAKRSIEPYDETSRRNLEDAGRYTAPQKNFQEENFLYEVEPGDDGLARVAFVNRRLGDGLGLSLTFTADTLPYLSEWKMMGEGDYVVAIEPINTIGLSRDQLRKTGRLPEIAPGEKRIMRVEFTVLDGAEEIVAAMRHQVARRHQDMKSPSHFAAEPFAETTIRG